MENMGTALKKTMSQFLVQVGICPNCKGTLYQWRNKNQDGADRCGPTCIACGHREMIRRNQERERTLFDEAKRKDAINRMKNNSMITDDHIWQCTFDNYQAVDPETKKARELALSWSKQIVEKRNLHAIMTGKPGAGKTHLGMATIQKVMDDSNYTLTCAIVSYRELLEQLKFAMNDAEARKSITGGLMNELKKIDFVVIDDLGAELGDIANPNKPTPYNLDTLNSLVEARLNRSTMFTSNLNSDQLLSLYGERIYSRILNGAGERENLNALRFINTTDKRRNPL